MAEAYELLAKQQPLPADADVEALRVSMLQTLKRIFEK